MKSRIKNLLFDSNQGKIKLNERASIFFFCIAISTFFWFLSSLAEQYTTDLNVPLNYTNYNKGFILVETPPEAISVIVTGSGFDLLGEQMSLNRKPISIDLSKITSNEYGNFGISTNSLRNQVLNSIDKDLKFERIANDSLLFKTDIRVSKQLKIKTNLDVSYESSYNLNGDVSIEPRQILVSGPKEQMDSLEFITTDISIDRDLDDTLVVYKKLSESGQYQSITFDPDSIKVIIPVEKFTEKIFELEVTVKAKRDKVITFPNTVKAIFLVPLNNYELLEAEDLKAEVYYDLGSEELKKLPVRIKNIPSFAKLLRTEPEKVEFIINQ